MEGGKASTSFYERGRLLAHMEQVRRWYRCIQATPRYVCNPMELQGPSQLAYINEGQIAESLSLVG